MISAAFIPIKVNSERTKGKNFRKLGDKPLYRWIFDAVREADCFDKIYIDTNANKFPSDKTDELMKSISEYDFEFIDRVPSLAENTANGNDLMVHWRGLHPEYEYYFQLFVTSPFLKPETISKCKRTLVGSSKFDSVFTAIEMSGWYWFGGMPVNYMPSVLPRSQDAHGVLKETTALYGIRGQSIDRYHCRIGANPKMVMVEEVESIDIDTEQDYKLAEYMADIKNED